MIKFFIRKRGLLASNTASAVLALVVLLILVVGAWKAYDSLRASQEERTAQASINSLQKKIEAMKLGDTNKFLIQGVKPDDEDSVWFIVAWSKDDAFRPDKCFFESCVCICKTDKDTLKLENWLYSRGLDYEGGFFEGVGLGQRKKKISEECQKTGFCRKFKVKKINSLYYFKFEGSGFSFANDRELNPVPSYELPEVTIVPQREIVGNYFFVNEIPMPNTLNEIKVTKGEDFIAIQSYSDEYIEEMERRNLKEEGSKISKDGSKTSSNEIVKGRSYLSAVLSSLGSVEEDYFLIGKNKNKNVGIIFVVKRFFEDRRPNTEKTRIYLEGISLDRYDSPLPIPIYVIIEDSENKKVGEVNQNGLIVVSTDNSFDQITNAQLLALNGRNFSDLIEGKIFFDLGDKNEQKS